MVRLLQRSHVIIGVLLIAALFSSCSKSKYKDVDFSLIPVESGEKWGYINPKGAYVINPQFQKAYFFRDGLALVVATDGKCGFIDEDGKYVIPPKYKDATPFFEGLAFVVEEGGMPTCIDKKGEQKFVLRDVDAVCPFIDGMAMVRSSEGKIGWIDRDGKYVINPNYEEAGHFCDGYAPVYQNEQWGYIDKTGKMVINPQFERAGVFAEGKALFYNGKEYGYINKEGGYAINPQFDRATDFSEGFAAIKQGEVWGYINEEGRIEINPQFDGVANFSNGYALIAQNDKLGYIAKDGKIVINPQFDSASDFFGDYAIVESADKWGIIDKDGKYIVNPQFDYMNTGVGQAYDFYVRSDYYDASEFLSRLFGANESWYYGKFLNGISLRRLADDYTYGDCINASSRYEATCQQDEKLTDDISIEETTFEFESQIYSYSYNYYYDYEKEYNLDAKCDGIKYEISVSGKAYDKVETLLRLLIKDIEDRFDTDKEEIPEFTYFDFEWSTYANLESSHDMFISVKYNYRTITLEIKKERY